MLRAGSVAGRPVPTGKKFHNGKVSGFEREMAKEDSKMANCLVNHDSELKPICPINTTKNPNNYKKIQVLIDSGAAESVIPPWLLPDYAVKEGEATRQKVKYTTADGNIISNLGEIAVPFRTREGHKCGVTFQVCDVARPLLSVTALTEKGNKVTFNDSGGRIIGPGVKQCIDFAKRDGVYVLDVYVPPFQGQGM